MSFIRITPYHCLKVFCLLFTEILLLLSFISVYVVLQYYYFAPYPFLGFLIFFIALWLFRVTNFAFSDFSVLVAVFFYDLAFGSIIGLYTSLLLFYFLYLRERIYCYMMDNIKEIYFFLAYLCLMYAISSPIQCMILSLQHSLLLWRL